MRFILTLLALFALTESAHAYTVEITQKEIQSMVASIFPIKQQLPFVSTTLSDPRIHILRGNNRLRLSVAVSTAFSNNITSSGVAEIEGEVDYDSVKGEFYLRQPTITKLQFDQLPQEYEQQARSVVSGLTQQSLPIIVIYRLDEKDIKQAVTRRVLKGISVKDGKLVADLDW